MNQIETPVLQKNKSTNGNISNHDQSNNNHSHSHSHSHQAAYFNSDLQDCGFDSCGSDINTSFNQTNSKNLNNTSDYSQSLSYLQQQLHIDNLNNAIHCNRIHLHPHYQHHHNHSPYNNNMTDGNDSNNNNSEFHYHIHHNHNCQPSPMMSSPSQGTDVSSTPSSLIMNMGCTHNHSSHQQHNHNHNHNIAFNYQQQNNLSIDNGGGYNHINNCQASDGTPNSAVDCICHKNDQQSYKIECTNVWYWLIFCSCCDTINCKFSSEFKPFNTINTWI
ncbi:unnamed protein product [[Candida] boidinii]|nr:unnamed protein product [[Candida] boidinii]